MSNIKATGAYINLRKRKSANGHHNGGECQLAEDAFYFMLQVQCKAE